MCFEAELVFLLTLKGVLACGVYHLHCVCLTVYVHAYVHIKQSIFVAT